MSNIPVLVNGVGMTEVSPPVTDPCTRNCFVLPLPVLSVMYKREPSVERLVLVRAIVRNLGCLEYARRRKGLTEPSKYSPESNDQRRHKNYNLPDLPASGRPKCGDLHSGR